LPLPERKIWRSLERSKKQSSVGNRGALTAKVLSLSYFLVHAMASTVTRDLRTRRPRFDSGPVHVRFVKGHVTRGRFSFDLFRFPCQHHCISTVIPRLTSDPANEFFG
jgi:hypothetical protein